MIVGRFEKEYMDMREWAYGEKAMVTNKQLIHVILNTIEGALLHMY